MNVLSLFDGMSCGQQALERIGIKVDNYFASEIKPHAIKVTQHNYPNTKQLGSIVNVDGYSLPKIDLLIGGSPCQSFSFAGKRKGMSTKDEQEILTLNHYMQLKEEAYDFEGQSYLFWEYMRLLNEVKPKYFLLENVMMGEKWEKVLSKAIGVKPIMINSNLVSAQNRQRLYWTNIGLEPAGLFGDLETIIKQPKDKGILLKDILEKEVDLKYFINEKMIKSFENHKERHKEKDTGFGFNPKNVYDKGNCLRANAAICPTYNMIIVHNMMPRSSTSGKGGTGHLTRNDGKTYCLDTGNTNAVEYFEQVNSIKNDGLILSGNMRGGKWENTHESSRRVYDSDGKAPTIPTMQGCNQHPKTLHKSKIRRLTPLECERLQTVKDNYTNYVSDSQRYKMLGNGWTVDIIAHIFSYIK